MPLHDRNKRRSIGVFGESELDKIFTDTGFPGKQGDFLTKLNTQSSGVPSLGTINPRDLPMPESVGGPTEPQEIPQIPPEKGFFGKLLEGFGTEDESGAQNLANMFGSALGSDQLGQPQQQFNSLGQPLATLGSSGVGTLGYTDADRRLGQIPLRSFEHGGFVPGGPVKLHEGEVAAPGGYGGQGPSNPNPYDASNRYPGGSREGGGWRTERSPGDIDDGFSWDTTGWDPWDFLYDLGYKVAVDVLHRVPGHGGSGSSASGPGGQDISPSLLAEAIENRPGSDPDSQFNIPFTRRRGGEGGGGDCIDPRTGKLIPCPEEDVSGLPSFRHGGFTPEGPVNLHEDEVQQSPGEGPQVVEETGTFSPGEGTLVISKAQLQRYADENDMTLEQVQDALVDDAEGEGKSIFEQLRVMKDVPGSQDFSQGTEGSSVTTPEQIKKKGGLGNILKTLAKAFVDNPEVRDFTGAALVGLIGGGGKKGAANMAAFDQVGARRDELATERGKLDTQIRGQDLVAETSRRGQDLTFESNAARIAADTANRARTSSGAANTKAINILKQEGGEEALQQFFATTEGQLIPEGDRPALEQWATNEERTRRSQDSYVLLDSGEIVVGKENIPNQVIGTPVPGQIPPTGPAPHSAPFVDPANARAESTRIRNIAASGLAFERKALTGNPKLDEIINATPEEAPRLLAEYGIKFADPGHARNFLNSLRGGLNVMHLQTLDEKTEKDFNTLLAQSVQLVAEIVRANPALIGDDGNVMGMVVKQMNDLVRLRSEWGTGKVESEAQTNPRRAEIRRKLLVEWQSNGQVAALDMARLGVENDTITQEEANSILAEITRLLTEHPEPPETLTWGQHMSGLVDSFKSVVLGRPISYMNVQGGGPYAEESPSGRLISTLASRPPAIGAEANLSFTPHNLPNVPTPTQGRPAPPGGVPFTQGLNTILDPAGQWGTGPGAAAGIDPNAPSQVLRSGQQNLFPNFATGQSPPIGSEQFQALLQAIQQAMTPQPGTSPSGLRIGAEANQITPGNQVTGPNVDPQMMLFLEQLLAQLFGRPQTGTTPFGPFGGQQRIGQEANQGGR